MSNSTIYDIAQKAGVSISTVSLVLNHPERVRESTRKKVEQIFRKYKYTPNAMARGLASNSMKTIGILSNDIRHLHFAETVYTLQGLLFEWGFSSILCNTGYDMDKKKKYIRDFAARKIDALVLLGSVFNAPEIEEMVSDLLPDTPVVLANGVLSIPNAYSVLIDNLTGMELVIEYLTAKGHDKIVMTHQLPSYNAHQKMIGFRQAMEKRNLPVDADSVVEAGPGYEQGIKVVAGILEKKPETTAIVCADDLTALGVMKGLQLRGKAVPADVAVTGYDNSLFSAVHDLGVTSVDTRNKTFSTIVAHLVHDLLSGRQVGSHIYVKPELVIRQSA